MVTYNNTKLIQFRARCKQYNSAIDSGDYKNKTALHSTLHRKHTLIIRNVFNLREDAMR